MEGLKRDEGMKNALLSFFLFKFPQDFPIYQTVNVKVKRRNDKNDCTIEVRFMNLR